MIQITNLHKTFFNNHHPLQALRDFNLEIPKNQFLAIVGPSGSGKSTLLHLIGGLITPTEGHIFVNKKDLAKKSDSELSHYRNDHIGFIFQEFHLQPELTVLENVLLPSRFNRKKPSLTYAKKIIKEVGLSDKLNSQVRDLSGGQKQRTAIARALINKPKILLADEPTGNLDDETGALIIKLLKSLHRSHKTTLIIATHDQKVAKSAQKTIKLQ